MANVKMEKCLRLMLLTDKSQKVIAKEINVAEKTISEWKKTDEFKKMRDEMNKEYFQELGVEAIKTMRNLMKAKSELVRFNAAKDLLDRAGFAPIDKKQIEVSEAPTFVDDLGDFDDG